MIQVLPQRGLPWPAHGTAETWWAAGCLPVLPAPHLRTGCKSVAGEGREYGRHPRCTLGVTRVIVLRRRGRGKQHPGLLEGGGRQRGDRGSGAARWHCCEVLVWALDRPLAGREMLLRSAALPAAG